MLLDGFYVTAKPLRDWSFQDAAVYLFKDTDKFLKQTTGINPTGEWELTCFPFKKYTNQILNESHIKHLRDKVLVFLRIRNSRGVYYTRVDIANALKKDCEYPPYPLSKGGSSMRAWTEEMWHKNMCFNQRQ